MSLHLSKCHIVGNHMSRLYYLMMLKILKSCGANMSSLHGMPATCLSASKGTMWLGDIVLCSIVEIHIIVILLCFLHLWKCCIPTFVNVYLLGHELLRVLLLPPGETL